MAETSAILHDGDREDIIVKRTFTDRESEETGLENQAYDMYGIDDGHRENRETAGHSSQGGKCQTDLSKDISEEEENKTVKYAPCFQFLSNQRGVLYTIVAAFFSALASMGVASLSGSVSPNEVNFVRMFIQLLSSLPLSILNKTPIHFPRNAYLLVLLRCFVGAVNSALLFYTFQIMPVANAKSIHYSSPIFAGLLGWILLKESCSFVDTVLSFVTLGGVILVAQPPFLFENVESVETVSDAGVLGSILSLLCAFLTATVMIMLRKLNTYGMPALTVLPIYSVLGMIISAALTSILRQWTIPGCGLDRIALIGNGLLLMIAQILAYIALKTERASNVTLILSSDVLFAFILEFLFFGVVPNYITVIGAVVIIASFVGLTVKKWCVGKNVSDHENDSITVQADRHKHEPHEKTVGTTETDNQL